jgi:hypothetical protein
MSMRRWWRGSWENGVDTNASARRRGLLQAVHARTDGDDLGVVVLAAQLRGVDAPGQRAPDARDLVRRDLLPVAGAADHDAEAAGVVEDGLCRGDAVGRVVVGGVVGPGVRRRPVRAQTDEVGDQMGLELEAGVIGAEVDAHDPPSCTIVHAVAGRAAGRA